MYEWTAGCDEHFLNDEMSEVAYLSMEHAGIEMNSLDGAVGNCPRR